MKRDNLILLGGIVVLISGFSTFLLGMKNVGITLTLIGVGVYFWDKHIRKD